MFNKKQNRERKGEIQEIKRALIGVDISPNSFNNPACHSLMGTIKRINEESIEMRRTIHLLLDELGYSLKQGARLVKDKKKKK